jgi:hypothetical protein
VIDFSLNQLSDNHPSWPVLIDEVSTHIHNWTGIIFATAQSFPDSAALI